MCRRTHANKPLGPWPSDSIENDRKNFPSFRAMGLHSVISEPPPPQSCAGRTHLFCPAAGTTPPTGVFPSLCFFILFFTRRQMIVNHHDHHHHHHHRHPPFDCGFAKETREEHFFLSARPRRTPPPAVCPAIHRPTGGVPFMNGRAGSQQYRESRSVPAATDSSSSIFLFCACLVFDGKQTRRPPSNQNTVGTVEEVWCTTNQEESTTSLAV